VRAEVARLTHLVDSLLSLARAETAGEQLREPLDLTDVAGAVGPPVPVRGDRVALRRLVENLVTNAERHAETVQVRTCVDGDDAVLTVDDDGPGIPAADRDRVFQRWVRLDPARTRTDGGVGLGLSVSQAIAKAHGGTLHVADSPLGGARLELRLPLAR
jgi:signal transduction histidine kinase